MSKDAVKSLAIDASTGSEALFRMAIEAAPTGMMMVDQEGRIVLVNAQVEKLFGYRREELVGKPVEFLVPERFRGRHPAYRDGFCGVPRARAMGAGRDLYGLRKDGAEVPIEIGLNPLVTPEGTFVLSSIVDITERKRAAEQFRLAIEAAPTGMMMVDKEGRIVLINAQVEKLFGYGREEIVGKPVEMLVPDRLRGRPPKFRGSFFSDPHARPMGGERDLFGLRKDGTEVPIEVGLNPLVTPEGTFVLSSIVDITERKRAAQHIQTSLNEKETLLKEIHHRVKNNLQVISSLISLQVRQVTDGPVRNALEECQTRVYAIALIHEKLHQSKDFARVPFSEYVTSLAGHILQTGVFPSSIELELSVETLSLSVDKAIPCGLILNELITNALKHAFPPPRRGLIRVGFHKTCAGEVELSVADDGAGIPSDFDMATSRSLGMQLVATLVDQLEGRLTITQSGGTTFSVMFPTGP